LLICQHWLPQHALVMLHDTVALSLSAAAAAVQLLL
jgi:hypothetical protein